MNESEFLAARADSVRRRIGRRSAALVAELERTLGPEIREHPRTSLALGASAGLLIGGLLGPALRTRRGTDGRGLAGFLTATGLHALRGRLAETLTSIAGDPGSESEPAS